MTRRGILSGLLAAVAAPFVPEPKSKYDRLAEMIRPPIGAEQLKHARSGIIPGRVTYRHIPSGLYEVIRWKEERNG
jgi:hypothetical protein